MRFGITKEELSGGDVPDGEYTARVHKVKDGKSRADNNKFTITWKLTGTEPPAGQMLPESVSVTPETYWKIGEIANALGYEPADGDFNSEELINRECRIKTEHREFEGLNRATVVGHWPL